MEIKELLEKLSLEELELVLNYAKLLLLAENKEKEFMLYENLKRCIDYEKQKQEQKIVLALRGLSGKELTLFLRTIHTMLDEGKL